MSYLGSCYVKAGTTLSQNRPDLGLGKVSICRKCKTAAFTNIDLHDLPITIEFDSRSNFHLQYKNKTVVSIKDDGIFNVIYNGTFKVERIRPHTCKTSLPMV